MIKIVIIDKATSSRIFDGGFQKLDTHLEKKTQLYIV